MISNTVEQENGLIQVRRCMTLGEFLKVVPISESEVRHNKGKYSHLMVRTSARKVLFDAFKVSQAIQNGNLIKG